MRKSISIGFICLSLFSLFILLSGCGSNSDSGALGIFSGLFSEEDQELINSIADGSSYEEIEEMAGIEDAESTMKVRTFLIRDLSEEELNSFISGGEDFLWNESETDSTWTEEWYAGDNVSGPYKTLRNVDYLGCCSFVDDETNSKCRLYLIYQVQASQVGSDDGATADYIKDCQTDFEYYWYVRVDGTSGENTTAFTFVPNYTECANQIVFNTYVLGGFDMVNTISKNYHGYNTFDELYADIANTNNSGYTMSDSTF